MFVLVLLIAVFLLAGFFLAMFGQPIGWILLAAGAIALIVALARRGVDWGRFGGRRHPHGPEDVGRGPDDDPMH